MCCTQYHNNQVANTKPESGKRMINYNTNYIITQNGVDYKMYYGILGF